MAEGGRLVRKLLASRLSVHSMLTDAQWLEELTPDLAAHPDLDVYVATKAQLQRIIGFHVHQGVMAVCSAPRAPDLDESIAAARPPLLVALAGVTSHENVGGIVRTAAGFGATGLIADGATCDPFVRRAARASMGAIFELPIWRTDDLPGSLRDLRERHGVRSLAAHIHEPCTDLPRADLDGGLALVLGAEGEGVPPDVLAACDLSVRIPMRVGFDCFNVATSAAILLYEIVRRHSASD